MAAKLQVWIECDLCQWPGETFVSESQGEIAGWIKVNIVQYDDVTRYRDKWLCPSCVRKVVGEFKSRENP